MSLTNSVREKIAFCKEFWDFLRVRKKWWLAPIIILSVLLGLLIVLTHGSALAPFIYTIF
jgi:Family of unknown function (DUF5989)